MDLQQSEQQAHSEKPTKLSWTLSERRTSSGFSAWLGKVGRSHVLIWAALVVLFTAFPLVLISNCTISDADIWWHMRAGEWILQHHQFLRTDPFSATTLGAQWVDYSWLFEVVANVAISTFDLSAIIWFQIAIYLAVTAALLWFVRGGTSNSWRSLGLTALGMLALMEMFSPRPGAFTVLFFVLEFHLLLQAERTGNNKILWALPPLFVVWANIHIEFVDGLFLLGVFCMEAQARETVRFISERNRGLPVGCLWSALAASVVATLINPYGIGLYATVFHYAHDAKVYDAVAELRAMPFRRPEEWAVLMLLMLGCFTLGRAKFLRPAWLLLLPWAAWMSFRSQREMWLVPVVALAVITERKTSEFVESRHERWQLRIAVALGIVAVLSCGAGYWRLNARHLLLSVVRTYPAGAVRYIHEHHLQGPILNEFSWGGFLIYALPEIPVSMDGRTNVHSQDQILQSVALFKGEPGWDLYPGLRDANLIICDHWWPLSSLLRKKSEYRVVYEDPVSVLFQKVPKNN